MRGAGRVFRHRLEAAGIVGLRALLARLEPEASVAVGAALGRTWSRRGGPRTADADVNLRIAFPDWTDSERDRVRDEAFANLGRHLAEVCLLQGPHRDRLLAGIEVEGHEHYAAARERSDSGGLIVVTAHFGAWELCATGMAERGYPVSVVGHPLSNPFVQDMVTGWRRRAGAREIPLGRAATGVFRALARGRVVAMLLDQNAHAEEGVFAPFFGRPALTRAGPARLAMGRGVPIVPIFIHRQGSGPRHVVRFEPSVPVEPAGDDPEGALVRNTTRINAVIEAAVRASPDHWMWPHRRFKNQPPGIDAPYARRRRGRYPSRGSAAGR